MDTDTDAANTNEQGRPGAQPAAKGDAAPSWMDGLDDAGRTVVGTKGWKEPKDVVRSYAELEKLVGADTMAVPKAGDAVAFEAAMRRLGTPAAAADYEVAVPDGLPDGLYSDGMADWFRNAAHKASLTQSQVQTLHDAYVEQIAGDYSTAATERENRERELEAGLRKEFGKAYDQKVELAKRAAAHFGEAEQLDALEEKIGSAPLIKLFAKIGEGLGEDTLIGKGDTSFALTPATAQARIQELKGDKTFLQQLGDKDNPGNAAAKRRWRELHDAAYPATT